MLHAVICGGSGYTGIELIQWLKRHPAVRISAVTAGRSAGKTLNQIHPSLDDTQLVRLEDVNWDQIDIAFCCLPHGPMPGSSMHTVPQILNQGVSAIDLSGDFRLKSLAEYKAAYGHEHHYPELLEKAVYGLSEWYREKIQNANLIANPGCYPTSVITPLKALELKGKTVLIDAKSGMSGAGRNAKTPLLYAEMAENMRVYATGNQHRHVPEMEQALGVSGLTFTAQVVPMIRGMLSHIYISDLDAGQTHQTLRDRFDHEPFVQVLPLGTFVETRLTYQTNQCVVSVHETPHGCMISSSIDNLVKGAVGQAIQNMNIRFELGERSGLI